MQAFTIKDIENLTGIKAHTLRIWEQRYDFFKPKRKESKHRIYDNEDLKRLLRIAFLYHDGWKVSKIASLSEHAIIAAVQEAPVQSGNYTSHITRLIEAMLDFNELGFNAVLSDIIEKTSFEESIVQVCYPYLVKLGNLWSTNHAIPAQEHFSTYLIQNRVIVETDKLPLKERTPEIVLICPQGEFHELPLLFINYLLRKNGWSTAYLGTNIKLEELNEIIQTTGAAYIYLHLLTNFTGLSVDDYLESICLRFRSKQIIASGGGAQKSQRPFVNLKVLNSDKSIYDFIYKGKPI